MDRFFVSPQELEGDEAVLGRELSHRLRHVLRLRPGARVILVDGHGGEYEVELTDVSSPAVRAAILSRREGLPEPDARVVLYQSIIKGDRFDWVMEKGTEIGVAKFVPLLSRRSVVRPRPGRLERRERWLRIITEAAEQCGRSHLPELAPPASLNEAVESAEGLRLLPWEGENEATLRRLLRSSLANEKTPVVSIFVGPEGGFARQEVDRAVELGARIVSLGPRTLRSETAGIVAAAAVLYELGELGA
ncbi:MAG TPA: 16S rRNA (uracil(1498)-N(3))-methyltransferase [Dehalococcoidia bacterium]|nr:16S rRNA (uracil(1498)-N(3))-methyltransferase [Dehalococcoidia bacterium]